MKPRVTVILPSIYPDACSRALRNIRDATRGPHEVILVSPFPPPVEIVNLQWLEETVPAGSPAAQARAVTQATGRYVTACSDDHLYVDGWDSLAVNDFESRGPDSKLLCLGLRQLGACIGTAFGVYYPYFPFMRRSDTKAVGWYDPAYRAIFGDVDLGLRVWASGGRCEWSAQELLVPTPEDAERRGAYPDEDMRLCIEKWHRQFGGPKWDTSHLRGFNIDVPVPLGVKTLAPCM